MDKRYNTDELLAEFLPMELRESSQKPLPVEEDADCDEDMKVVAEEDTKEIPVAEEDDVKIFSSAGKEESTKQIPSVGVPLSEVEKEEEETSDQLCFEEWDEAAVKEEQARREKEEHEAEMEEHLKNRRKEKIREFNDDRRLKLTGEEETSPEEEIEEEEFEEDYVEDFCSYEDAEAVASELRYRRARHRMTTVATVAAEALLLFNVLCYYMAVFQDKLVYVVDSAVILGIMMLLNRSLLRDGFEDVREGEFSGDSSTLLCCVVVLVHTLAQLFHLDGVTAQTAAYLLPVLAGAGLSVAALARQLQMRRLCANFAFVGREEDVYLAHRVEDEKTAVEIGAAAVAMGKPEIAYFTPVSFLHRFLDRSYTRRAETPLLRMFVPGAILAAALVAVVYGFVSKDVWQALYFFALSVCVVSPLTISLAVSAAFWRSSRYALNYDGMLIGQEEVDEFGDLNAVCVDAADLFPEDNVILGAIKTFAGTRIDEAILDAAAVVIAADGPLQSVFRRVIQDKVDLLQEVDTLVYEQEMGLSGWVGGRRVLVGNRRLLENHGVDVPSRDYEMRYTRAGRKLVYLSTAGELSAMFVVAYTADARMKRAVKALTKEDVTLLVRTSDPNITEELLCETFNLSEYYVEILGSGGRRALGQVLDAASDEDDQEAPALACDGGAAGKAAVLTVCNRLRKGLSLSVFATLGLGLLGFLLCVLDAFTSTGDGALPSAISALLYMMFTAVVGLVLPHIRRT